MSLCHSASLCPRRSQMPCAAVLPTTEAAASGSRYTRQRPARSSSRCTTKVPALMRPPVCRQHCPRPSLQPLWGEAVERFPERPLGHDRAGRRWAWHRAHARPGGPVGRNLVFLLERRRPRFVPFHAAAGSDLTVSWGDSRYGEKKMVSLAWKASLFLKPLSEGKEPRRDSSPLILVQAVRNVGLQGRDGLYDDR